MKQDKHALAICAFEIFFFLVRFLACFSFYFFWAHSTVDIHLPPLFILLYISPNFSSPSVPFYFLFLFLPFHCEVPTRNDCITTELALSFACGDKLGGANFETGFQGLHLL